MTGDSKGATQFLFSLVQGGDDTSQNATQKGGNDDDDFPIDEIEVEAGADEHTVATEAFLGTYFVTALARRCCCRRDQAAASTTSHSTEPNKGGKKKFWKGIGHAASVATIVSILFPILGAVGTFRKTNENSLGAPQAQGGPSAFPTFLPTPSPTQPPTASPTFQPRWVEVVNMTGTVGFEQMGRAVDISHDGSSIAFGGVETGTSGGYVRVYHIDDEDRLDLVHDEIPLEYGPSFVSLSKNADSLLFRDSGNTEVGIGMRYYRENGTSWWRDPRFNNRSTSDPEDLWKKAGFGVGVKGRNFFVPSYHADAVLASDTVNSQLLIFRFGGDYYDRSSLSLPEDFFISSGAISDDGNTFVVGSPYQGGGRGEILVYRCSGQPCDVWDQRVIVGGIGERMGHSVAITSDGSTIAVAGIGVARVYDNTVGGNGWSQRGERIGVLQSSSEKFTPMAFSNDATSLIIGNPWEGEDDGSNRQKGEIHLYRFQ